MAEKLKHNRYMRDRQTVCNYPERLGSDFVIIDLEGDGGQCDVCFTLLEAHTERESAVDSAWREIAGNYNTSQAYAEARIKEAQQFYRAQFIGSVIAVIVLAVIIFAAAIAFIL